MEDKNIPRRMKRFYRNGEQTSSRNIPYSQEPQETDFGNIPSMEYEDLEKHISDENKKEISRLEQTDLEQKLALFEVEKFKKENKRLPNKKESQQIADNLYSQFKESGELLGQSDTVDKREGRNRRNRGERMPPSKRKRMQREGAIQEAEAADASILPKGNIKDLFESGSETGKGNSKSFEDEFKLDVGGEEKSDEEDFGELENLDSNDDFSLGSLDEKGSCPNCNEKTDKVIYCSKCGAAFCEKCGKKGGEIICPKCGIKVK